MLSIRKELKQGLTDATGLDVYFIQPPVNTDVAIPLLILEEKSNSQYFRSNTLEVANLSYDISIYTNNPSELFDLMESVDDYMSLDLGLKRTYTSSDMSIDYTLWCKTMTYVCKATQLEDGTIKITQ